MNQILIFVKAPEPGFVKTRLAERVGAKTAARLSRAMAIDTVAVAQTLRGSEVVVAYEPSPRFPNPGWLGEVVRPLNWFPQKGRDLGARLRHATAALFAKRKGPLTVIGSDLPLLTPLFLARTRALLQRHPAVLGPARDGGYYLLGLAGPVPTVFDAIPWSTAGVLAATRLRLKSAGVAWRELPPLGDLDTGEDLDRLLAGRSAKAAARHFPRTAAVLAGLSKSAVLP